MSRVGGGALSLALVLLAVATHGLESVPDPDLSGLEAGVRERLRSAREALVSATEGEAADPAGRGRLYGHTGKVFHAHHIFEVAEACYSNAAELDSEEPLWPYLLGYLYQDTARHPRAREQFQHVLELDSEHPLARLRLAQVLLELDEIEAAKTLLDALDGHPELGAPTAAALGKIADARGELAEAVDYYEEALRLQPRAGQLHFPLAVAYRRLGELDKAREHAAAGTTAKLVVADPILEDLGSLSVSSEMFLTAGAQALKAERFDLAEKSFRAAIAVNPDNKRAHLNLGVVLAGRGELDAAEDSVREALRVSPDYYFAYLNLADIYERRGRIEDARRYYRRALEGDSANLKANFRLANLLMRGGDYDGAAGHYRKAVAVAPSFVQARYLEALALVASGRLVEARKALEEAVAIHPGQPELTSSLARLLATSETVTEDDAYRALALARTLDAHSVEGLETLAMALAAVGRFEEAIVAQQALIEAVHDQDDPGLLRHLEHNLERYRGGRPSDRPWAQ
ncbi:MAG: tetratricopeptide repeat protein [Thermoanaerobaculia bacterium]